VTAGRSNESERSPGRERTGRKQSPMAAVMVGFDGSISSQHALAYAAGLSHRIPGALYVAYVAALPSSIGLGAEAMIDVPVDDSPWIRELAAELLQHRPTHWEFISYFGEVAPSLELLAREYRADVLVVGRSRAPRLRLLASVPARLARRARCPITVVP
jgi:nucleotide-binding universal stress UspA family protein